MSTQAVTHIAVFSRTCVMCGRLERDHDGNVRFWRPEEQPAAPCSVCAGAMFPDEWQTITIRPPEDRSSWFEKKRLGRPPKHLVQ